MGKRYVVCLAASLFGGWLLMSSSTLVAQETGREKPDNTKVNKRDREKSEKTADQAKDNSGDRDIMQKIRKAVMADKSLSTYAHNVKIISEHGKVTLKGPVHSEQEKETVEAKAVEVAGAGNVTNQLTVKGDKSAGKKRT
jgi:hyperosmotically inducible periplasmic protein